ncbi:MAG: ribulose-phosphate 3-epimerase [Lentisphaeria bacterium]|nr:ribulose-phosphate 3-epimerase [Lentisphaeria bacterium]
MSEASAEKRLFTQWPNNRILVAPSLLAAHYERLLEDVTAVEKAGAEVLHLDIMDGHFVPNLSFGADLVKALRPVSQMLFDVHLMITDPIKYAPRFKDAGADHITFHVEVEQNAGEVIDFIHSLGCTAGISLRPGTSYEAIMPYLDKVEMVLVMTVEPGFGGQSFHAEQLPKIETLRKAIDATGKPIRLEVDGGIAQASAELVRKAGADVLVAGSSVFRAKDGDYKKAIDILR